MEQHFIEHQSNFNIIFQTSNELERIHLLMNELKHMDFGFQRTEIQTKRPLLDLLNYSSNRLKHHFFDRRTDSNVFILW